MCSALLTVLDYMINWTYKNCITREATLALRSSWFVVRRRNKCDSHKTITKGIQFQWLFRYSGGTGKSTDIKPEHNETFPVQPALVR
jgi:hypothetical protein